MSGGEAYCPACGNDMHCTCSSCDAKERRAETAESFDSGAAVAFGLIGMFEAIGRIQSIEACDGCGRASRGWVTEMAWPWTRRCLECADAKYAAEWAKR